MGDDVEAKTGRRRADLIDEDIWLPCAGVNGRMRMSWTIERRGRVAVVTMNTNKVKRAEPRVLR
jgi:hypothetical protein